MSRPGPRIVQSGALTLSQYRSLHDWVRKHRGRPNECEHCGTTEDRRYDWANKSNEYKRELDDWLRLCGPCHRKHDGVTKTHCKFGHALTGENIYDRGEKGRECRTCKKESDYRVTPISRFCTVEGCDNKHKAQGYCPTHYWYYIAKNNYIKKADRLPNPKPEGETNE